LVFLDLLSWGVLRAAGCGFARDTFPDAVRPLEIMRMALTDGLAGPAVAGFWRRDGPTADAAGVVGAGSGAVATGICIVMDVEVANPMTSLRFASSYVDLLILVAIDVPAAADVRAEPRLVGSPLIRLRINCVAALNWGTYRRPAAGELAAVLDGAADGAGLGVVAVPGAIPAAEPAAAGGAVSDMLN